MLVGGLLSNFPNTQLLGSKEYVKTWPLTLGQIICTRSAQRNLKPTFSPFGPCGVFAHRSHEMEASSYVAPRQISRACRNVSFTSLSTSLIWAPIFAEMPQWWPKTPRRIRETQYIAWLQSALESHHARSPLIWPDWRVLRVWEVGRPPTQAC